MPREIVKVYFVCNTCNAQYLTLESAQECESLGRADLPQVHTIFQHEGWSDTTLSVVEAWHEKHEYALKVRKASPLQNDTKGILYNVEAYRHTPLSKFHAVTRTDSPSFYQMAFALYQAGYTPFLWDGEEVQELTDELRDKVLIWGHKEHPEAFTAARLQGILP